MVDAVLDDWTEDDRANHVFIPVQDGQSARIYGKVVEEGVLLAVEALHFRYVTTSENTFGNSNFRFAFNQGEERFVNSVTESKGVTSFSAKSALKKNKLRQTVFEIFVNKEEIENFGKLIPFGFVLRLSGYSEDYFWGYAGDWRLDGCDLANLSLYISEAGIVKPAATDGRIKIDGRADEEHWDKLTAVSSPYHEYGRIEAKSFLGEDGAYFCLTAIHRENNIHQYWCYNPNFEIRIGETLNRASHFRIARYDGRETLASATVGEAEMVSVFDLETKLYTTVCEVFIPYENIRGVDGAKSRAVLAIAFRADEDEPSPFVPLHVNGLSTWNNAVLTVTKQGLEH